MSTDQTYFPEFSQRMVDVGEGIQINTLVGGEGKEALLLLHRIITMEAPQLIEGRKSCNDEVVD